VLDLQADPTRFISSVQVAITMSSLAAGAVGEPAVRAVIEGAFDPLGEVTTRTLSAALSVAIAFLVVTAITVVLGEIVPKTLSLARTEAVALATVNPVRWFSWLFRPFIGALDFLSRFVTRVLGLPSPSADDRIANVEELRLSVEASFQGGELGRLERALVTRVFEFAGTEARQVMVPRRHIAAFPAQTPIGEALDRALGLPHTRYPVVGGSLDDVLGIVTVRALVEATRTRGEHTPIAEVARPVEFVSERTSLEELLAGFQRTSGHLAVVVDEYGSTSGIVTLEDVLEEIVGPISDETDPRESPTVRLDDHRVVVPATMSLDDVNDNLGTELADDEVASVGGLVTRLLGRIPEPGDVAGTGDVLLRVRSMDGPRITRVEVERPAPGAAEGADRRPGG
jgi:CBS domain containing-hemolysin-like protein